MAYLTLAVLCGACFPGRISLAATPYAEAWHGQPISRLEAALGPPSFVGDQTVWLLPRTRLVGAGDEPPHFGPPPDAGSSASRPRFEPYLCTVSVTADTDGFIESVHENPRYCANIPLLKE